MGDNNYFADCPDLHDLKEIGYLIDKFTDFYECPTSTLKPVNVETIKKIFQISASLEKSVGYHEDESELKMWKNLLITDLLKVKNLPPKYDADFFIKACDLVLAKFFMLDEAFLNQTDIAVRIYTSMLHHKRFRTFLYELLTESASHQAVQDFIFENEDIDIKTLQFKLIMQDWIPEYEEGRNVQLAEVIKDMMSPYKSKKSLHILVGIIGVDIDSNKENYVKELVLNEVLQKMLCRSKLSKGFWLSLFEVDSDLVMRACTLSQNFHESLCKFLIFLGSNMDKQEGGGESEWVPTSSSIYPEFTYEFLVREFGRFSDRKFARRDATIKMILKAEEETKCAFWKHLLDLL